MLNSTNKVCDLLEFKPLLINQNRLMGLDLGKKRIGISISTLSMNGALPLRTVEENKFSDLLKNLAEIIKEYNVQGIIFGLPLNMDGTEGKSVQSVRDKAEKISIELNIKYSFWDERLSTVAVDRFYEKPIKGEQKKKFIKKILITWPQHLS
jgi:putative Holliday junction resolvase